MRKLMSILMLNCEHASLLLIKKENEKLSFIDKSRLWIHTKACHLCKEFEGQNEFINVNTKVHFDPELHSLKLSETAKEKLAKEMSTIK